MWYWTGIEGNPAGAPLDNHVSPGEVAGTPGSTCAQVTLGCQGEARVWEAAAALRLRLRERFSVSGPEQVACLIEELGFCHAFTPEAPDDPFPVPAVPSLFEVLPTHDEDIRWDWSWTWKDGFLESGRLYYGKLIHRKPTYVSSGMLPWFYAMTGNLGEDDDCANARDEARVGVLACSVYEHIAARGATSTIELQQHFAVRRTSLDRALTELQTAMLLVPVGTRPEGPRRYTYVWDLFPRRFPQAVAAAASIGRSEATEAVILRYLQLAGAAAEQHICRALPVPSFLITHALNRLEGQGLVGHYPPSPRSHCPPSPKSTAPRRVRDGLAVAAGGSHDDHLAALAPAFPVPPALTTFSASCRPGTAQTSGSSPGSDPANTLPRPSLPQPSET
ncbi:MAG: hypothetical protein AB1446_01175 [Bacillota bacterium]